MPAQGCEAPRFCQVRLEAADDVADELAEELKAADLVVAVVATCGQGAFPQNARRFWHALETLQTLEGKAPLQGVRFCVLGLGDSAYYFFCEAAKKVR